MNNSEIIVAVTCFLLFCLDLIFESIVFNKFAKLYNRVDDLEKQLNTIVCNLVSYEKYYNSGFNKLHDEIEKINGDFDAHCDINRMKFVCIDDELSNIRNPFKRFRKW